MTHAQTLPKSSPTSWNQRLATQRGSSTVEMGLLLLPFFLLFMSVMEMGWYFFHQHTIQYATREGMRLALVGNTLLDPEGNPLSREDSIKTTIKDKSKAALDPEDLEIYINKISDNYLMPIGWENLAPNAGEPADFMRIIVKYDHEFLIPLIGGLFPGENNAITLQAEATYRNELFQTQT